MGRTTLHFRNFIQSRGVAIVTSLLLIVSGLFDVIQPFFDEIDGNEAKFGAHHGVWFFGLVSFLRVLSEATTGAKDAHEGLEKFEKVRSNETKDPAFQASANNDGEHGAG